MAERAVVLLVEDNEQLNDINRRALERENYRVLTAFTLEEARACLAAAEPDVIILDIMLPDGDGVSFCREIRERIAAPILFLTSVTGYEQTLAGLSAGGDDYLNKPFDLDLLLAKVAAFLRRDGIVRRVRFAGPLVRGALRLDVTAGRAWLGGEDMELAPKEFAVLLLLVQNEGRAFAAEKLYQEVWKQPMLDDDHSIKNVIYRLRRKLAARNGDFTITMTRGEGYRFEAK